MVGWHHPLNGYEFEQALGDSEGQGRLVCYSSVGSQRLGHDLAIEQMNELLKSKPMNSINAPK